MTKRKRREKNPYYYFTESEGVWEEDVWRGREIRTVEEVWRVGKVLQKYGKARNKNNGSGNLW